MTGKIPKLGMLILILGMLSGCCSYAVKNDAPCPERPKLTAIPQDLQLRMPPDALWIVGQNQLALKEYAKKLEARACLE